MSDVITILYKYFLNFNPKNPEWINRDRFILSAGHGSMLLYSVLHLTGYKNMTINQIKKFRQLNSKTAGHPEYDVKSGIETTTGPLGQGLGNSVGMAIAEKHLSSIFGKNIINHNTFVVAGDGCLMEGISLEAISLAGHLKLNKLIVLFDDNNVSIDGPTNLSTSENHLLRFKACNWDVQKINGHNFKQIYDAINKAKKTNKPSLIACKTIIGYASPNKQGKNSSHGAALGLDEVKKTKNKINWEHPPFIIPNEILKIWRKTRLKGILENKKWDKKLKSLNKKKKSLFGNYFEKKINNKCFSELKKIKTKIHLSNDSVATRKASNIAINSLLKEIPFLLGGSADLTESNLTKGDNQKIFSSTNNKGTYIYYGIREHAMAAAMTGIS